MRQPLGTRALKRLNMADATSTLEHNSRWCLESTADGGKSLERVLIHRVPFRIGRLQGLDLTLPFQSVSKRHAKIVVEHDALKLRDLESTNGTFVNRKRVRTAHLREGDILHIAEFEFRVSRLEIKSVRSLEAGAERGTLALDRLELQKHFVSGTRELEELLDNEMTGVVFQPIVSLIDGSMRAFELLGRGRHPELPESPTKLFQIAEVLDREAELSRLLRRRGLHIASQSDAPLPLLFMNTHPSELHDPALIDSLEEARTIVPKQALALEIHEGALAEPKIIAELKKQLDALDIRLALDDFGLGERFLQLAEVPPDYLKFDMSLVKDLVNAPASKRRLLAMLMAAAREVGAEPIAEGIETREEAAVCSEMGFSFAQGYLLGEPVPLVDVAELGNQTLQKTAEQIEEHRQRR